MLATAKPSQVGSDINTIQAKYTTQLDQRALRSRRVAILLSLEDALRLTDNVDRVPKSIVPRRPTIVKRSSLSKVVTAISSSNTTKPSDSFTNSLLARNVRNAYQLLTFCIRKGLVSRPSLDLAKLDEVDVESAAGANELQLAALGRLGSSLPHAVHRKRWCFCRIMHCEFGMVMLLLEGILGSCYR